MTHDSFAVSRRTSSTRSRPRPASSVEISSRAGDAGAALNRAALTRARPLADVLFGVDEGLLARARAAEVFEPYVSPALADVHPDYRIVDDGIVTPIDVGFVTFNLDRAWFEERGTPWPTSLADLADPRYGAHGRHRPGDLEPRPRAAARDDRRLGRGGGVRLVGVAPRRRRGGRAGWSDAYYGDFTRYGGDRPIVLSYASSPAAEVMFAEASVDPDAPPTVNLRCVGCSVRQVETAGILAGTPRRAQAERLVDFLLSESFQAGVPETMFVYPVRSGTPLPEAFERYAELPEAHELMPLPAALDGATVDAWIERWTRTVLGRR
jgi:thiamine transport system substrate-binding protein